MFNFSVSLILSYVGLKMSSVYNRTSTDNTMYKRKRTNNDLRNITQKTKDRATRIPQKTWSELKCSGMVTCSCSTCSTYHITLATHPVIRLNKERKIVFYICFTGFGTALTTILPILFQYCYTYCYSDSRNLWVVMKAGGLAL